MSDIKRAKATTPGELGPAIKAGDVIGLRGVIKEIRPHHPPQDVLVDFGDARGLGMPWIVAIASNQVELIESGPEIPAVSPAQPLPGADGAVPISAPLDGDPPAPSSAPRSPPSRQTRLVNEARRAAHAPGD